jgi:hypothetical protein
MMLIADGGRVYEISDDDTVTDDQEKDSNSVKLGKSLVNAIVIICVIALFTFVLVFCYYMKCMKVQRREQFRMHYNIIKSTHRLVSCAVPVGIHDIQFWTPPLHARRNNLVHW